MFLYSITEEFFFTGKKYDPVIYVDFGWACI